MQWKVILALLFRKDKLIVCRATITIHTCNQFVGVFWWLCQLSMCCGPHLCMVYPHPSRPATPGGLANVAWNSVHRRHDRSLLLVHKPTLLKSHHGDVVILVGRLLSVTSVLSHCLRSHLPFPSSQVSQSRGSDWCKATPLWMMLIVCTMIDACVSLTFHLL